ncbi:hypothetical protein [Mycobacterium avium]|uniref:hypothetical protein n=1 Tax=Mycobacterium avium TaxID=1764 RepID=UPI0009C10FB9
MYFRISTGQLNVESMSDVVICRLLRTPVGRKGEVPAHATAQMASQTLRGLSQRCNLCQSDAHDVEDRMNPNGSTISLRHPLGVITGAQRLTHCRLPKAHRRKGQFLLHTMSVGGAQGVTAVFETNKLNPGKPIPWL